MKIQPNDWKLTAYALGELDNQQRAEIEAQLANSPELQQIVDEIRATADVLSADLATPADARLTDAQRQELETAAAELNGQTVTPVANTASRSVIRKLWLPTAMAASLALAAGTIYMFLPTLYSARHLVSASNLKGIGTSSRLYSSSDNFFADVNAPVSNEPERTTRKKRRPRSVADARVPPRGAVLTYGMGFEPNRRFVAYDGTALQAQIQASTQEQERQALRSIVYLGEGDESYDSDARGGVEFNGGRWYGFNPGVPWLEPPSRESYDHISENPFLRVSDNALSTFSIDVDTASYANVRRFLTSGQLPPPGAVRIEELINYFAYDYPQPTGDDPFSVNVEIADCPWDADHRLARIGLKGYEIAAEDRVPANLVFLIDVSGSMQAYNKLPLLKTGLIMLASELNDDDYVSIVVYAGASGLVLPSTLVSNRGAIIDAVGRLSAGGSTNGGAGIELAYEQAMDNFIDGGVNRVILATDGDFNVGTTDQSSLIRMVEEKAKSGVFLTVLGFGMGNFQDSMLEKLADKGNGNYAYIDNVNEAQKVLVEQIGGTLVTIAKDVKIQVEFNPAEVAAYRLVGYENRLLAAQDFNDDTKDAGEIGAGHTVTAFYEIIPVGEEVDLPAVDPLKYQTPKDEADAAFSGELMTVKLRYKPPDGDTSELIELPVVDTGMTLDQASDDFLFAASVASFGMLLRHSNHSGNFDLPAVREWAASTLCDDSDRYRVEFIDLVDRAMGMSNVE